MEETKKEARQREFFRLATIIRLRMGKTTEFSLSPAGHCGYSHEWNGVGCAVGCLLSKSDARRLEGAGSIPMLLSSGESSLHGLIRKISPHEGLCFLYYMQVQHDFMAMGSYAFDEYLEEIENTIKSIEDGTFFLLDHCFAYDPLDYDEVAHECRNGLYDRWHK